MQAILLLFTGCTFADEKPVVVDERAGILRGVRFGDTEDEVRARLGAPTDDYAGVFPEGTDYTGPPFIPNPVSDQGLGAPKPLHYEDTFFLVSRTTGVFVMGTLDDGARTRAGVEIGDNLDDVRAAYERVDCGDAVAGEPLFGGDTPMYPWCRAHGDIRVFFGEDPIESITISSTAARG